MKKKCCMDNQIDIFAYQQTQLRRKERELKKKPNKMMIYLFDTSCFVRHISF